MVTTYVLDTNELLHNPSCLNAFPGQDIVLYIGTLEECDRHKKSPGELGFNARTVNRMLAEFPDLAKGQKLENGGTLTVTFDTCKVAGLDPSIMDNAIIGAALYQKNKGKEVVLVSQDANMLVKSQAIGLKSQRMEDVEEEETFTGRSSFEVSDDIITEFNSGAELNMDGMSIFPNEIVELISKEDPTRSVSGIFNGKTGRVEHMPPAVRPFGLYPRSKEQSEAIALLMNNDIDYISLSGGAGSGKTILAVSCALELVIEQQRFQKLLILRNVCPAGLDVGFLPGGLEEKLAPWAGSVEDALEVMLAGKSKGKGKATKPVTIDDLKAAGVIEFQPLTYLRGRSLANTLILIEEMQDVTTADARTILSRVSRGSKVISTGCIKQIDLRGNDKVNNGLTYSISCLKKYPIVAHLQLTQIERSPLAAAVDESM